MKISPLITILLCAVIGIAGCIYGYYRGYQDRSRILTLVNLNMNEFYYEQIKDNDLKQLQNSHKIVIYSEAQSLRFLNTNSLQHFSHEFLHSRAGDTSEKLKKADEITVGMEFPETPPSFTGITEETK